jgi:hypothetical protein
VDLPTNNVKSYTKTEEPVTKADSKLRFGKYGVREPFTVAQLTVHFESKKDFKKVGGAMTGVLREGGLVAGRCCSRGICCSLAGRKLMYFSSVTCCLPFR